MPLVSIVIPAFNTEQYIQIAVESALAQTIDDLEVIVVDDGSTDNTAAVIQSIEDSRVKYVYQHNQERSAARNHGISLAIGDFIAFLDADDWWKPDKLEKQIDLFRKNPDLGLTYCWVQATRPTGKLLWLIEGWQSPKESVGAWVFDRLLFHNIAGPGSSILVPREVLESVGGFRTDLNYAEDWEFCLRVANRYPLGFVPEALAYYRLSGTYVPHRVSNLRATDTLPAIISNALRSAGLAEDSLLARRALARVHYHSALIHAGVEDYASCNARLAQALALDPELVSKRKFVEFTACFADLLYDTGTPLKESITYVKHFFDRLDEANAPLRRLRRQTLGWLGAVQVFRNAKYGTPDQVRSAFWHTARYGPSWLANLGLVTAGLRGSWRTR